MRADDPWHRRFAERPAIAADTADIGVPSLAQQIRSQIPQRRKQRGAEQRDRPHNESKREDPEAAAARLVDDDRRRRWRGYQRMFALDAAARALVVRRIA